MLNYNEVQIQLVPTIQTKRNQVSINSVILSIWNTTVVNKRLVLESHNIGIVAYMNM